MCEEICSNSQTFDIGWRKSTSSTSQYYERRADVTKGGQNKSKNIWFAVQHSFALHLQACCERAICIHRRRREQMSSGFTLKVSLYIRDVVSGHAREVTESQQIQDLSWGSASLEDWS